MTGISERYRRVAGEFTRRAEVVPEIAWDNPAPCEGWVARDVVRHMVEWMPSMVLDPVGVEWERGPSVDEDPAGAWAAMNVAIQSALDDPAVAAREFDMQVGRFNVENAVDMFCTGDILVHTWDLARATGLDETLDADEVHRLYSGMEPMDEVLRKSGHYGPRVEVPEDADEQTRLIGFTGRRP
ncbi:MAG: TIGR03086 family metal-binding protein [Acidimicrobiia bacterium]